MGTDNAFWEAVDTLVKESRIVIDRPKGSVHPRFPEFKYPIDYGYLEGTKSPDGGGIDLWLGSDPALLADAIICTVDLFKRDSEINLLIGCTEDEKKTVMKVCNGSRSMKGVMFRRD